MKLYHATTSKKASRIVDEGFRGATVWEHENCVFFADRPLPDFGDLSGSSWIVIDADAALLALDVYDETEREWDEEQYSCKCYCLPTDAVNQRERWEEQRSY